MSNIMNITYPRSWASADFCPWEGKIFHGPGVVARTYNLLKNTKNILSIFLKKLKVKKYTISAGGGGGGQENPKDLYFSPLRTQLQLDNTTYNKSESKIEGTLPVGAASKQGSQMWSRDVSSAKEFLKSNINLSCPIDSGKKFEFLARLFVDLFDNSIVGRVTLLQSISSIP